MFGVFLDIEGAFDSTLHILIEAARWRGLEYSLSEEPLKKKNSLKKSWGIAQSEQQPAKNNYECCKILSGVWWNDLAEGEKVKFRNM